MKKKNSFGNLERFPIQNVQNIISIFFFFFYENEKNEPPLCPPFWGGSSAASPLEIWDVTPPYLKRLFEQKAENW